LPDAFHRSDHPAYHYGRNQRPGIDVLRLVGRGEGPNNVGYDAEIRRPLDRGDWEQREIYAHFGLALYFCQVVEAALVNYLLLLHRATGEPEMTESEIDDLFVELFGNTLGRNIHNVKRILGEHGDWVLADQMADTLKLRNELVHHWMRTRALLQGTSENRLAMIDELESAAAKLQDADRAIRERTQAMLVKADLPEGLVQAEYQRLTDLAERGEDDPDAPEYFSPRRDE
jgi:hypothetical protein